MTPDFGHWTGSTPALSAWRDDIDRALDTAQKIAAKPSSIVIQRPSGNLAAQTVRIEVLGVGVQENSGPTATIASAGVLIIGYKSHPTIADTDIRRGDQFFYNGLLYNVVEVMAEVPDRLLAIGRVRE